MDSFISGGNAISDAVQSLNQNAWANAVLWSLVLVCLIWLVVLSVQSSKLRKDVDSNADADKKAADALVVALGKKTDKVSAFESFSSGTDPNYAGWLVGTSGAGLRFAGQLTTPGSDLPNPSRGGVETLCNREGLRVPRDRFMSQRSGPEFHELNIDAMDAAQSSMRGDEGLTSGQFHAMDVARNSRGRKEGYGVQDLAASARLPNERVLAQSLYGGF